MEEIKARALTTVFLIGLLAGVCLAVLVDFNEPRGEDIERRAVLEVLVEWQACAEDENCWRCIDQVNDLDFCLEHAFLGVKGIDPKRWQETMDRVLTEMGQ